MPVADLSVSRAGGFTVAANWAGRLARWWLHGLRKAVPRHWVEWADGGVPPIVVIRRDGDGITCSMADLAPVEARFPATSFNSDVFRGWLSDRELTREQVVVQAVIPRDLFFVRDMSVPQAALAALPKILDQELLRRTPFQPIDVWHAATVVRTEADGVASIWHWIIRKDRAASALTQLGLTLDDIDSLATAASAEHGTAIPVIEFQAKRGDDPVWAIRMIRLLAAAAIAAVVLALLAFEWSQAGVAAAIEDALAEARQSVHNGQGVDPVARLYAMRSETGVLETLDELSRVLPDHTFLSEVRIADGKTTITGFSANAALLVRTIDQSPKFSGAALISAITPDANEHKERFTITFRSRGARTTKSPVAVRSAP
ncbi:PilN domain-containing protein [Bradyrhizobium lablabi]|uniref:PilN domain-containing protein n=1 Tax=Bradyrhizobium lablabi TaxID=722472 RepID=UPI001BAD825E|nr:PilN domain-containing protein [Bradyrhizobium lablabi]MBR0697766.1 PilN domain-containing protein [Bradyrhizobium lablabi]